MQQSEHTPKAISKTAHEDTAAAAIPAQVSEFVISLQLFANARECRNNSFIINRLVTLGRYISLSSSPDPSPDCATEKRRVA